MTLAPTSGLSGDRAAATHHSRRPTVSVIMPIYNAAPFLEAAIESVRRQTFSSWELLLADDGSSDGSFGIAESAARQSHGRVTLLAHPDRQNRGVSATRNLALARARGDLLAFLDADDVWFPERLERQVALLQRCSADTVMAYSRAAKIDETSRPIPGPLLGWGPSGSSVAYSAFLQGDIVVPTLTVLLRRDVMAVLGGFPEGLAYQVEDFVVWARALKRGRALFVDFVAAEYRVHSSSSTGRLSTLQKGKARLEGLLRIADDEGGIDDALALAMARQAKAFLVEPRASWPERLQRASSTLRALSARGGLTPGLAISAVRRRARGVARRFWPETTT